jgi:hypothetical protein
VRGDRRKFQFVEQGHVLLNSTPLSAPFACLALFLATELPEFRNKQGQFFCPI